MKYNININQRATDEYNKEFGVKLNHTDMTIFDYLFWICTSPSDKVIAERLIYEDKEYTWINYSHLIKEMPIVKDISKSSISRILHKLEKAELIETQMRSKGSGKSKYVRILDKAEKLFSNSLVKI